MFAYLKGKIEQSQPGKLTIEVNKIGYQLYTPIHLYSQLPSSEKEVCIYTSLVVKEDSHTLFGFLTKTDRDLFEKLITISGVGPKMALALLGHFDAPSLHKVISQGNSSLLNKVPGIGKKTAERLIIELKDLFSKKGLEGAPSISLGPSSDAMQALMNLGYNAAIAQKAVKKAVEQKGEDMPLAELITLALKSLG